MPHFFSTYTCFLHDECPCKNVVVYIIMLAFRYLMSIMMKLLL